MRLAITISLLFWSLSAVIAQDTNVPLNEDTYSLINRYQILGNGISRENHSSFRPYLRSELKAIVDSTENTSLANIDLFNIQFIRNSNGEIFEAEDSKRSFLKQFYKKKADLFRVQTNDLDLHINPVFYFSSGYADNTSKPFINTRGLEIRATIDNKVGFYTFLSENQARFPEYVRDWTTTNRVVPHEAFWKDFNGDGVDFFTARGYISFNASKHINIQFGQDAFFIGNGIRSIILSDFSGPFPFLKFDTRVWKFQYTNLFGQIKADAFGAFSPTGARRFPNKYFALHHLSYNVTKNFNLGIFESIVYGRADSLGNNPFEIGYLNPVIFYRSAEQYNGSDDNALLGIDFNYTFLHHFQLYGQFLFDEFLLKEIKAGDGWWGNKYAFQLGAKYINVLGISGLDLQLEYNQVRPFTYSHRSIFTNYSNYLQPLAHPLGANFRELVGNVRFQPLPKLTVNARLIYYMQGVDQLGFNYGSDIMKSYTSRTMDYGNDVGQGIKNNVIYSNLNLSYMIKHNLFIDGDVLFRKQNSDLSALDNNNLALSLSLRLNIQKRLHEF